MNLYDLSSREEFINTFKRGLEAIELNRAANDHWQTTDATIQQKLANLTAKGVKQQSWNSAPGCCDDCLLNDGQTVPIGKPFKSGALSTPNHDHCECETVEVK